MRREWWIGMILLAAGWVLRGFDFGTAATVFMLASLGFQLWSLTLTVRESRA